MMVFQVYTCENDLALPRNPGMISCRFFDMNCTAMGEKPGTTATGSEMPRPLLKSGYVSTVDNVTKNSSSLRNCDIPAPRDSGSRMVELYWLRIG